MSQPLLVKPDSTGMNDNILLQVQGLKKYFPIKEGLLRKTVGYVKAVDGVDLYVKDGETLGLAGESGCGKSTLGRSIARLIEPSDGQVRFRSRELGQAGSPGEVELTTLDGKRLKQVRREIAYIFQDPVSALNPRMRVGPIVKEPLEIQYGAEQRARFDDIAKRLLEAVGLRTGDMLRYPHEFSGGQRQRISIARALVLNPKLIICDEPTSALDVSIQGQIINLLKQLQSEFQLTYIFISHNLAVIQHVSDRVAIMYLGEIVELAEANDLFRNPRHPYTEVLLSAVYVPDPDYRHERMKLKGEIPSPANPPSGCRFHTRCPYAQPVCSTDKPPLRHLSGEHFAACHFAEQLSLRGITDAGMTRSSES
jgi:peptide/nickel transport system ATP-binding protein